MRLYTARMTVLSPPEPIDARPRRRPNATTRRAMTDARSGRGVVRCEDAGEMFRLLDGDGETRQGDVLPR